MQKIATKVFICASVAFAIIGIASMLTSAGPDKTDTFLGVILNRLFGTTILIILSSFALSVAGKYLK